MMGGESFGLGSRIMLSNLNMLKRPYKLNFAVTYRCNSRCTTCGIWRRKPSDELSAEEIELFSKNNPFFSWLNLTGGEPFLRKDLPEIAASFAENLSGLCLLNLTTNGLTPKPIESSMERIMALGIPRLMVVVSLDGCEEVHDRIRGIKGAWQKALETFRLLKALSENGNLTPFFGYTISRHNLGGFGETVRSAKERIPDLEPEDFHVNLFHSSPHYYANVGRLPRERVLSEISKIERVRPRLSPNPVSLIGRGYLRLAKRFVSEGRAPLPCKSLKASLFLDPSGNVYPCTIYGRRIGNVRDTAYDLSPILRSEEAKKAMESAGKDCPQCWTPCEAYQAMLGNVPRAFLSAWLTKN
jgi:radical SAM protein with 4Fe4S-binding SPASM domain